MDGDGTCLENRRVSRPCGFDPLTFRHLWSASAQGRGHRVSSVRGVSGSMTACHVVGPGSNPGGCSILGL